MSGDKKYAVGTVNVDSFIKSERMVNQVSMISLVRGSFQVNMICQIPQRKILALTVTGVTKPNGLYTCDQRGSTVIYSTTKF